MFNVKWVILIALSIFEIGSLICGLAPNSTALIIGRAIAGLGSAGIFTGALVTIAHTVRVSQRPAYFGLVGGMYGIASVAGPLVSFLSSGIVRIMLIFCRWEGHSRKSYRGGGVSI